MSDLLSIGASGVRAYQSALTTVSDNIANVGTAGYARRTADLREVAATGSSFTTGNQLNGLGVRVDGVARSADAYISAAVRDSSADLARTQTGSAWLGRIETALTGNQFTERMTDFFNSAKTLAADPTSLGSRSVILEAASAVSASFTATARALDQAGTDLDDQANGAVANLNALGAALAKVNLGLGRTRAGTAGAAALADQRDQLLEQMSAIVEMGVQTDSVGRATVRLGGQSGSVFVSQGDAGTASFARNEEGSVGFAMVRGNGSTTVAPTGGLLAGIADGAQRIVDARGGLNSIANDFVTAVNTVQENGDDLDGNPGRPVFAPDLSVVLTDPRGIAAAASGGGARDASNLDALDVARSTGQVEAKATALIADNASMLEQRKLVGNAQGAIRDAAIGARDAVTAVDLDTEAVDLLRFQQAYQASSRIIQVARETFQSILEIR